MVVTRAFRAWLATLGPARSTLRALTAAALALPGLAGEADAATPRDALRLQYGRYEEDDRRLPGVESRYDPIDVDYLQLGATVGWFDRSTISLDYAQDTWSGATPIASAPQSLFGNRASAPDGVSGATPYLAGDLYFDGELEVLESDLFGQLSGRRDPGLVHTLSSASPETRQAIDVSVDYEWDDAAIATTGGLSTEPDYLSGFARVAGRLDFDRKQTSLDLSASYSTSEIDAHLDHDAAPYIDVSAYRGAFHDRDSGSPVLRDRRSDWTLDAGLSRILRPTTRIEASLQFRQSRGLLANPYKVVEVAFLDPAQQFLAPPGGFFGDVHALLERRPRERSQVVVAARLLQDWPALHAATSLRYALAHDDWGIDAHTFEAQWRQEIGSTWLVTPRIRYTTQGEADFYRPLLVSQQAYRTLVTDPGGNVVSSTPFDHALLPAAYSGDHRLSAFGALSGGFVVQKQLLRGFLLELGFEYARYAGDLRLGGGGEGDFSRFDAWSVDAALRIDLTALALARESARETVRVGEGAGGSGAKGDAGTGGDAGTEGDARSGSAARHAHGLRAPAGVMFAHALPEAGDFMLGYRTMYMRRDGDFRAGSGSSSDADLVDEACGTAQCSAAAESMAHQMHMLDLMFAPTRWLSLMLMPSYVVHEMNLRALDGAAPDVHSEHDRHATGGFGDTRFGPIVSLLQRPRDRANVALLVSAPTGDTSLRFRRDHQTERGFVHYDMQLGSGTWDLLPSLTYQGERGRFGFGAQAGGVVRLEGEGPGGYALGEAVDVTLWGSARINDWLSASLRGLAAWQGRIDGAYDRPGVVRTPADRPENAGGRTFDLGIGVAVAVPRGSFEGMDLAVEWIQPLAEDWNGHQLERTGSLVASVGMAF